MRINMYILRDYLRGVSGSSRLISDRLACNLVSAGMYNRKAAFRSDTVYIAYAKDVDAESVKDGTCLFLSGAPGKDLLLKSADIIWTPMECDLTILIQSTMEVFSLFNEWENSLYDAYASSDTLQALGDSSLPFFRNPVSLYSRSFYILRYFEEEVKGIPPFHFPEEKGTYLQEEITNNLLGDSAFLESWKSSEPSLYYLSTGVDRCLYQNISIAGENRLRIVIAETQTPFKDSDYPVLAHLVKQYERYFQFHGNISIKSHPQDLEENLMRLLSGETISPEQTQSIFSQMHWTLTDRFVCLDVLSPQDEKTGSLEMACVRLEQNVPESIALQRQDHIFLLCNLNRSELTKESLQEKTSNYLYDNLMKAGISVEFSDISQLRSYYSQASAALEMGESTAPTLCIFNAEEYKLEYYLSCCKKGIAPQYMFPQGLLDLIEYDKKKGRNYANTLRVFLECNMSISATTQKLYLHRQTFLYQLERIKSISKLNLEDPDVRLHLMISYKLMDAIITA